MRFGINALYLIPGGVGGTEIYLRNLVRALAEIDFQNEYFIFTNRETGAELVPAAANFYHAPQSVNAVNRPARLLWEQTVLPRDAARLAIDCMLNPGFTAPLFTNIPNVTVFHDLQHKRHPEYFRRIDLPFWRIFLWGAAHRSRLLLADSEATKHDLLRFYSLEETKIRVVPLAVEDEFFRIGEGRADVEPFVLCVSTLHPHKNIERLIRAFELFRRHRPEFRLVLAGMKGFHTEAVTRMAGESIEVTGWIPREELYGLYRRAAMFVYPSTFEGFGLPVLEAMAARVPLACSDIEPLRSIAGEGALLFDPLDETAIAHALCRLDDSRVEVGVERARNFKWSETARKSLQAMEEAGYRKRSSS